MHSLYFAKLRLVFLILYPPFFRAIYEHQDQENLLDKLDARIRFHTREIEKLCASHLPGFMESVKQVQDVKEALISLKVLFLLFFA